MESKYVDSHLDRDFSKGDVHRRVVGGMWDEIGQLQFDYIKAKGHKPSDSLIDIGCGSFRGGTHFIPFLNKGKYFGFDINYKLIEAGLEHEVSQKDRDEKIILDNFFAAKDFEFPAHWNNIDAALSISLFTHLTLNTMRLCLTRAHKVLKKGALYHSTVFFAGEKTITEPWKQGMKVISYSHEDPYHYSRSDLKYIAKSSGFKLVKIEDFGHPRNQKMAIFKRL